MNVFMDEYKFGKGSDMLFKEIAYLYKKWSKCYDKIDICVYKTDEENVYDVLVFDASKRENEDEDAIIDIQMHFED